MAIPLLNSERKSSIKDPLVRTKSASWKSVTSYLLSLAKITFLNHFLVKRQIELNNMPAVTPKLVQKGANQYSIS
jgi:hypothetical protein